MMKTIRYTTGQLEFLRIGYPAMSAKNLTLAFNAQFGANKTEQQIKTVTGNHGIKSGRSGYFENGHKPWNTDTKGRTGANARSFKKGNVPANRKQIGSERICPKNGFVSIKVAEQNPYTGSPTRYKHKHVHIWERDNGPVPKGMVVAFRDSDKTNIEPENLMLISRAELLRLNKHDYKNTPEELKPSVLAMTRLEVKALTLSTGGES